MDVIIDDAELKIERLTLSTYEANAYIVICPQTGKSALIDVPPGARTIVSHLKGTQLEWILLTHNHIDHTGGLRATRERIPAAVAIHQADNSEKLPVAADMVLNDGDKLLVGNVRIEVIFTPGHTPGSVCFKTGRYLLAGDTLFPGGPGHTDSPEAFKSIIKSITEKLFLLPDDTMVLPGHGGAINIGDAKKEYTDFASREHFPYLCGDVLWAAS